jgi:hypothetical protein
MPCSKQPIDYVCHCGLYCKLCANIAIHPKNARALKTELERDHWPEFGKYAFPDFDMFFEILGYFANMDETSPLCKGGCGNPECAIRICTREKGVQVCALCPEYPCPHITAFAVNYPMLNKLNDRLRAIGLDAWIAEMEDYAAQGVSYRDTEAF